MRNVNTRTLMIHDPIGRRSCQEDGISTRIISAAQLQGKMKKQQRALRRRYVYLPKAFTSRPIRMHGLRRQSGKTSSRRFIMDPGI
ncbi:hypothetical protein KQX54_021470 [Cotesia glomerata]|uniref:Uncharacterized protein n=1 Tax=Cotesia glomerata TaxID=32391 RepID=A0AAV7J9P9_COTGL|nr:hypothetical protein KQX54_021470 [Cotesia glomerata]